MRFHLLVDDDDDDVYDYGDDDGYDDGSHRDHWINITNCEISFTC